MKALLVNGSPNANGCTFTALSEIANTLAKEGIESEILQIGKKAVAGCIACGKCRDTGKCIFDDSVNEAISKIDSFCALVVGSPVYYGAPSGQVCAFLDRLFFVGRAKWHGKIGAGVVSCRRGGATAAFDRLNKYFLMNNMPVAPSCYWNQIHGNTADEARQDAEGLMTMRVLAQNIAWLAKSIENAKTNNISLPTYEPRIFTNFIRQ